MTFRCICARYERPRSFIPNTSRYDLHLRMDRSLGIWPLFHFRTFSKLYQSTSVRCWPIVFNSKSISSSNGNSHRVLAFLWRVLLTKIDFIDFSLNFPEFLLGPVCLPVVVSASSADGPCTRGVDVLVGGVLVEGDGHQAEYGGISHRYVRNPSEQCQQR